MSAREKIGALSWLVVGCLVAVWSAKLGIGTVSNPGAGFMSFYGGVLLILLSLLLGLPGIRKQNRDLSPPSSMHIGKNFVITLASLLGFAIFLKVLGYLVCTALFVFVLVKMTAPKKWLSPAGWAIGVSLATYYLFSVLLKCNFPKGILHIG